MVQGLGFGVQGLGTNQFRYNSVSVRDNSVYRELGQVPRPDHIRPPHFITTPINLFQFYIVPRCTNLNLQEV